MVQYTLFISTTFVNIYSIALAYIEAGKSENTFQPALTVLLFRNSMNFVKGNNLMLNLIILISPIVLTKQLLVVCTPLHWGAILT